MNWTQPKCEACWIRDNWVSDDGVNIDVKRPARLANPVFERCAWCGAPTIFGLYVRENPSNLPFPAPEREEEDEATDVG